MQVYQPKLSVWLIKSVLRKDIVPGVAVSGRANASPEIDLTPFLGDSGSVQTTKSIRQAAGTFSCMFPDKNFAGSTLYELIEPMDMIEIRMAHEGEKINATTRKLPIIMRGFAGSPERTETIQGGKPMRMVSVTGHDFGKLLQMIQLIYLPYSISGNLFINEFRWFQVYAGADQAKNQTAKEFIDGALNGAVNLFIKNINVISRPKSGSTVIQNIVGDVQIDANVSPYTPNSFSDVSLNEMLRTIMDVPVFNEMYIEDREEGVALVVRPCPFKSLATGKEIQGKAESMVISADDIISQKVSRSDAGVANYYWVTSSRLGPINNVDMQVIAASGEQDTFVRFDYVNSRKDVFGIRKMDAETVLMPPDYLHSDASTEKQSAKQNETLTQWIIDRRKLLADMNQDNSILESGNLVLRGNEAIKAGMYLKIYRGNAYIGEVYAHTVSHDFKPFGEYLTRVSFDRGTEFYERTRSNTSFYYDEANG